MRDSIVPPFNRYALSITGWRLEIPSRSRMLTAGRIGASATQGEKILVGERSVKTISTIL